MAAGGFLSAGALLVCLAVCVYGQYETFNNPIFRPLDCKTTKHALKMLFGNRIRSAGSAPTLDECVARCFRFNQDGRQCHSVNYWRLSKTCDMFEDSYGKGSKPDWYQTLIDSSYCDHVVVDSCNEQPNDGTAPEQPSRPVPGAQARAGTCGKTSVSPARNRIVGGFEARAGSIPWIVSMRKYGTFHFCGGTLIRASNMKEESDIVITAAHCVEKSSKNPGITVVAGAHKKSSPASGQESVAVAEVVVHRLYNAPGKEMPPIPPALQPILSLFTSQSSGATNNNDIAILKLVRPIKFSSTIQPACLPSANEKITDGVQGIVAGWGTMREGGSTPDALQQVSIPTISYQKCNSQYRGRLDEKTQFCGGYDQGGKDSCQGDSGGPYYFQGRNGATLQGVVSWGAGCARSNAAGVYARVSNYIDWIQQQVTALSAVRG